MEFESIVHNTKSCKYTFYVVKDTLPHRVAAVVFKNAAHFFEASDDTKSFFESSAHNKLIHKAKNKFGVGNVENHRGICFTIEKQPSGEMEVRASRKEQDVGCDYTDEIYELLSG